MKSQVFTFLTILLLAIAIFMIYKLGNKISNINCPDGDCKYEAGPWDTNDDLKLSLELNNQKFRPLHLDLVNDFGILAKVESKNDAITKMTFKLKEVGDCERYTLIGAEYIGPTDSFDKAIADSSNSIRHHIRLTLNTNTLGERSVTTNLEQKFKIKPGDEIDVHFKSNVCTIPITEIGLDGPFKIKEVNRPETYFGNNICKAEVIE